MIFILTQGLGFECNPEEIGDDICHGSYNNQECAYDGGDCCSGTDEKCEHCVDYACICHETETIPCNSYRKYTNTGYAIQLFPFCKWKF